MLGKHSALVSRLSSCPTHQLGFSDNFSQVAASLGNKIKLAPPPVLTTVLELVAKANLAPILYVQTDTEATILLVSSIILQCFKDLEKMLHCSFSGRCDRF